MEAENEENEQGVPPESCKVGLALRNLGEVSITAPTTPEATELFNLACDKLRKLAELR